MCFSLINNCTLCEEEIQNKYELTNHPIQFQSYIWRQMVEIDIIIESCMERREFLFRCFT